MKKLILLGLFLGLVGCADTQINEVSTDGITCVTKLHVNLFTGTQGHRTCMDGKKLQSAAEVGDQVQ